MILASGCAGACSDRATTPEARPDAPLRADCNKSGDWQRILESSSISIRAGWGFGASHAAHLELMRVGDVFAVDGTFSTPPFRPRVATVSASSVEDVLCVMADHEFADSPVPESDYDVSDNHPAGEIVFRFPSSPPIRASFLDFKHKWSIAPWGERDRVLEPDRDIDPEGGYRVHHPSIDGALRQFLERVGPTSWTDPTSLVASHDAPGPLPAMPSAISNAASFTIEDFFSKDFPFPVRMELMRVGGEVLGTAWFHARSVSLAHTFSLLVPSAHFARWLDVLEDLRRGAVRATDTKRPLDPMIARVHGRSNFQGTAVARIPRAWPVHFDWTTLPPTMRIRDDVYTLLPPQAKRLHALRAEIEQVLDIDRWSPIAFDRMGEEQRRERERWLERERQRE